MKREFEIVRLAPQKALAQRVEVMCQRRQQGLARLGVPIFGRHLVVLFIEGRAHPFQKLRRATFGLPESDEVLFHFLEQCGMVGSSVGVDNVEDTLASDDEAVAEALAFWRVFAWLELWVLSFVVAGEVANNV